MKSPPPDGELRDLMDRLLGEGLRKSEMARLEERLEDDSEAMRYYLETMETEAALSDALESLQDEERPVVHRWWQHPAVWGLSAAAAVTVGFFLWPKSPPSATPVVRVTDSVGVRWQADSLALPVGAALDASTVAIDAGLLELTFDLGARVLLQAPTKFEITGRNSAHLHYGRLVAEVPEAAKHFTVTYPDGRIIDLGTEFGVSVPQEGPSEVCVFRGEIDVLPGESRAAPVRLVSDHAVRMAPQSETGLTSVPFVRSQFVRDLPSHELPWSLRSLAPGQTRLRWDVSDLVWSEGRYVAIFKWMHGEDHLQIDAVHLRRAGQDAPVSSDLHVGHMGDIERTSAPIYRFQVDDYQRGEWTLEATLSNGGPRDAEGIMVFQELPADEVDVSDYLGEWDYHHSGHVYRRVFLPGGACTLEIDGEASPHFAGAHYEVENGILRIHFDEFDWVEEHLMRGRDRLLFVNRPYRDARRVTPERSALLSTP